MVNRAIDISGQKFGKLSVIERVSNNYARAASWFCRCDCGGSVVATGNSLRSGNRVSCGCKRFPKTHGMSKTPIYYVWATMRRRCENPNNSSYHDYGGRGIKVCLRWHSFDNFYADMGDRPSDYHEIDRIDNNGAYSPDNCRWAKKDIQAANKRNNRFITACGETLHITEWARRLGCQHSAIIARLKSGMSEADAVTKPIPERPNAKLTPEKARVIRQSYPAYSLSQLAVINGVSQKTIFNIVHNKIFIGA